jgi:amino acid transporter
MKQYKTLLALATLLAVTSPAYAGVKKLGQINGVDIYRVKTGWSLTCPNTTTLIAADPKQPGTFAVINSAAGPGIVPAAANAGGLVGAAALLRPARSETNVNASGGTGNAAASGSGNATGGSHTPPPATPGWVPPGHRN